MSVPKYFQLFNPTLTALRNRGGSASNQELLEEVINVLELPPDVAEEPHKDGSQTKLEYRLAWARTYLKKAGLIDNSERGVWALTIDGNQQDTVDPAAIQKLVRSEYTDKPPQDLTPIEDDEIEDDHETESAAGDDWRTQLLTLLQEMPPDAFERLCQRLLRESGFIEVKVTGRPGDGGIDGNGIVRVAGLLSFPVIFQAKRYQGSVGASTVRDFRGAMWGRADKGLLITTGSFTSGAYSEATREGAPPIDLVDGAQLMEKLKELGLGVETKMVEAVEIDEDWFHAL